MREELQDVLDVADNKIALAIEALETAQTYNDSLTEDEKEGTIQDLIDLLEEARGVINA